VNSALTASGYTQHIMVLSAIAFLLNCILGFLLVPYGIVAAAAGFALRSYLSIFFNMYFFKQKFGISVTAQLRIIAPTFCAAVIMFGAVQGIKLVLPEHWSAGIMLVILAVWGGLVYFVIMSCIFRQETKHFLGESAALAPAKARPAIACLQRLLRLA